MHSVRSSGGMPSDIRKSDPNSKFYEGHERDDAHKLESLIDYVNDLIEQNEKKKKKKKMKYQHDITVTYREIFKFVQKTLSIVFYQILSRKDLKKKSCYNEGLNSF